MPFQIVANCTQQKYMTTSLFKGHVQVRHGKMKNCAWEQIGKKTLHELPIGINSELFVLLAMAGEARADCHISCSTYGLGSSNSSNLIRFLSNL